MTTPDDHECYPVPRFVTVPGRSAFDDDVHSHARELAAELDHEAAREINAGQSPEQTADTVRSIAAKLEQRRNGNRRSSARTAVGGLLVTAAGVGPPIVAGLLSQSLALVLASSAFGIALLVGLLLLLPRRLHH